MPTFGNACLKKTIYYTDSDHHAVYVNACVTAKQYQQNNIIETISFKAWLESTVWRKNDRTNVMYSITVSVGLEKTNPQNSPTKINMQNNRT